MVRPIARLTSSGFRKPYPNVVNKQLIPPAVFAALDAIWTQEDYPARDILVFRIPGAYVVGEHIILDREYRFIENANSAASDAEIATAIEMAKASDSAGRTTRVAAPTIYAKGHGANNYGHYLLDVLPRVMIAGKMFGSQGMVYLVRDSRIAMQDVTYRSFRLLSVSLDNIIVHRAGSTYFVDDLVVITGLFHHQAGTYVSALAVRAVEEFAQKMWDMAVPLVRRAYPRLFVRRVVGPKRGRSLHNEQELYARLAPFGFKDIDPGSLSLEQQIVLFSQAQTIIGATGAAMANIVFCRPGTKVTLLVPAMFPDSFFQYIAAHKQLCYCEIRCPQTAYDGEAPWEAGSRIEEKDIQHLVDSVDSFRGWRASRSTPSPPHVSSVVSPTRPVQG